MLIGTMGIPFTQDKGNFYCPKCRSNVGYRSRQVRRFLTFYFIPLIPLDKMDEYVECLTCRGRFPLGALSHSPEQAQIALRGYIRYTLALMAAEDQEISPAEMATYRDLLTRLYGSVPSEDDMARDLAVAKDSNQPVWWYLRTISTYVTPNEKKILVQYAFLMASADGEISEARNAALAQFPPALGITQDEFKQFVAEAVAVG